MSSERYSRRVESRSPAGGHYADPASPIASTPQRKPRSVVGSPTSAGALSPMHSPAEKPAQRKEGEAASPAIFSPVGKFNPGDEDMEPEPTAALADRYTVDCTVTSAVVVEISPSSVSAPPPSPARPAKEEPPRPLDIDEFNPYLFIRMLPEYATVAPAVSRIVLPKKALTAPPISLVLDLDETLVHCSVSPIPDPDLTFSVEFNGMHYNVFVKNRPYLSQFLEAVHDKFEVTVFTASQRVYAEKLLNLLDPEGKYIKYRLFRDSCLNVDGNYLKDLNVLGRDMRHTILVDNSPHAFGYQVDNGIPIESWFDDPADTELLKLAGFLQTVTEVPDVRPHLHRKFNVRGLIERAAAMYLVA